LPDAALKASLEALSGWDPNSGADIRVPSWEPVIDAIRSARVEETIPLVRMPPTTTRPSTEAPTGSRLGATLFGWGNYAKTIIVPSLPKEIALNRVHEVDPLQIPATTRYTWSTEATISADDSNPIVFVAGYHHTHNAIACAALRSGKAVVVEKPLVTTRAQLRELEDTARAGNRGRYFACFHKRYSPFNAIAIEDLGVAHTGEPIDYHCVVYEVPLPQKHWYRWPNSSTRIISNGCHWIDHFLFLNRFSTPANIVCAQAKSGVANVFIELENGASFSMTLTDVGSERIGVQDYIELRHKGSTVKITNGSRYEAENGAKVLRRKSINKISGYRNMYSQICRAIVDGRDGDSEISYLVSSETVLSVNEYFEQGC
jgi:predicted dehydrogenase